MNNELEFLLYHSENEDVAVNAVVKDETIWLTQKAMAELFGVQPPAISKHLKNSFGEGELDENVVISKMEMTTQHVADYLEEFVTSVNEFFTFRRYTIHSDKGKVSQKIADAKAIEEYTAFNTTQKTTSDFDREVREMLKKGKHE